MKKKIEKKIKGLKEVYNWHLQKLYDIQFRENWSIIEQRLHDLTIEINTYENVLEMLENENEVK